MEKKTIQERAEAYANELIIAPNIKDDDEPEFISNLTSLCYKELQRVSSAYIEGATQETAHLQERIDELEGALQGLLDFSKSHGMDNHYTEQAEKSLKPHQ